MALYYPEPASVDAPVSISEVPWGLKLRDA
jgi:hypothetical protein